MMASKNRSLAKVECNRANALRSTGPKTGQGKAVTRMNAVRHGLTANPAALGVEDAGRFEVLRGQLVAELRPRSAIEEGIVDRIAVSLWRLDRSVQIDAAMSTGRAQRVRSSFAQVQNHIARFHDYFRWEEYIEREPLQLRWARGHLDLDPGAPWIRCRRRDLHGLDGTRAAWMATPVGIDALVVILDELWTKFQRRPEAVSEADREKLAWLLGDAAETLPSTLDRSPLTSLSGGPPGTSIDRGPAYLLIERHRGRGWNDPLPPALESAFNTLRETLRHQRRVVADRGDVRAQARRRQAALLPGPATLDRMIRYETAAERSLYRALDMLGRLRGERVEMIAARVTRTGSALAG